MAWPAIIAGVATALASAGAAKTNAKAQTRIAEITAQTERAAQDASVKIASIQQSSTAQNSPAAASPGSFINDNLKYLPWIAIPMLFIFGLLLVKRR